MGVSGIVDEDGVAGCQGSGAGAEGGGENGGVVDLFH